MNKLSLLVVGTLSFGTLVSWAACMRSPEKSEPMALEQEAMAGKAMMAPSVAADRMDEGAALPMAKKRALAEMAVGGKGGAFAGLANEAPPMDEAKEEAPSGPRGGDGIQEAEPARTRSYFPETFLFEPLVLTDEAGLATLSVRVPDRLTTWRILALAHSRDGAQAGTETSFVGTLPAYVDPIVPAFLYAGDEAKLPIQVVNTTGEAFARQLRVEVSGAAKALSQGPVRVEAYASKIEPAIVKANKPGTILLKAQLADKDSVERTIPVLPTGRPLIERRGGTLAAPRTVEIALPANADPESTSARLQVFPGALAILRAELGAAGLRGGPEHDAYMLLLAGKGPALSKALGAEVDEKQMRAMSILAGQRAIRWGRGADGMMSALFAEAALSHPENPVIARLGERLAQNLLSAQRPDGTFEGGSGWTLQRLLIATADGARAAKGTGLASTDPKAMDEAGLRARSEDRAKGATQVAPVMARQRAQRIALLAEGAFERNIERVEDGYTAAAIVASGAVDGTLREKLQKRVRDKLRTDADGTKSLPIEEGVVRADGSIPNEIEATALAVLALETDKEATKLLPDLGARLLGAYDPRFGFGDGRTNLVALGAVLSLFKEPLPAKVKVTLAIDGRTIAEGILEGQKLKEVLVLDASLPSAAGAHQYAITAEPPVPGLGYSLQLKTHVPWEAQEPSGIELAVTVPKDMSVGRAVELVIEAAAPQGNTSVLEISLPAGVQLDQQTLEELRNTGAIQRFELEDGKVTLDLPPLPSGAFRGVLKAIPTLAGSLHSGVSSIQMSGAEYLLPPSLWIVR